MLVTTESLAARVMSDRVALGDGLTWPWSWMLSVLMANLRWQTAPGL